jgi:hypothetical protein
MILPSKTILATVNQVMSQMKTSTNRDGLLVYLLENIVLENHKTHNRTSRKIWLLIPIIILGITILPAMATPTVTWDNPFTEYYITDGCANPDGVNCVPVVIIVDDPASTGLGQIQIVVTSTVDSNGIILTLYETSPGEFQNENLALMPANNIFSKLDRVKITVTYEDTPQPPTIQGIYTIYSDLDTVGITPIFTQVGDSTSNVYAAHIKFGDNTDTDTNTIKATEGTIISIWGLNYIVNGIVGPNPSDDKGAIVVEDGGQICATYYLDPVSKTGILDQACIDTIDPTGGGGGGGGLVMPSLVIDNPTSSGDGNRWCTICIPPTLGVDERNRRLVSEGFSYNNQPVDVELFYTSYPLITVNVGQENKVVLKIYENEGPQNIQHVELGFGLARGQILSESKASILLDIDYDEKQTVSKYDPENVLQDIRVETEINKCSNTAQYECLIVTIYHTFRAPLDFNMVATNVWDFNRNAWQNYYNDGVQVIGESMNLPPTHQVFDRRGLIHMITETSKTTAIDESGNVWNRVDGFWIINESVTITPQDKTGRDSESFKQKKLEEIEKAKTIYDYSVYQKKIGDFIENEFVNYGRLHDPLPNMQKALIEYLLVKNSR